MARMMKIVYSMRPDYPAGRATKPPVANESSGSCRTVGHSSRVTSPSMSETMRPDHAPAATEHIELDLPLHVRHASTVRLVAGSVAADSGFSVDAIDDLRLAVNEVVSVLADVDDATAGRLSVSFSFAAGLVRVEARRRGIDEPLSAADIDPLATRILGAVTDEYFVDSEMFVVVKHAS